MTKVKEVTVQLGRPVNPNSVRQIRLAELESRKVNGTLKLGRPVNPDSASQKRLVELEAKRKDGSLMRGRPVNPNSTHQIKLRELAERRANGEVKQGRPVGSGSKDKVSKEQAIKASGKRFQVVLDVDGKKSNYSKSFSTPKSAIKEMKELGFTDYSLVEFGVGS